ncbi:MAG TPA: hypothetical protein VF006_32830 [Longimicrobium sp.]
MFRITRGMHVQHIPFPFPVIRDLDALEEDSAADAAPAPAPAQEGAAEPAASTDAPQRHD